MGWLVYALASTILLAASTLAARLITKSGNATIQSVLSPAMLPYTAAFAIFSILGSFAFLAALREPDSKAGPVAAVVSLNVAAVAVGANVFFGETISPIQVAGLLLAMASVFLLSMG